MFRKKDNRLALGEVTGHYHEAIGKDVEVYVEDPDDERASLMVAPNGVIIQHQEHKPVEITEKEAGLFGGKFKISFVREYDYDLEEARAIKD